MDALVCPFCSGIVDIENGGDFGKCKYCRRTFSMKNAKDMASASDADKENVVNWRKELMRCLDTVERSLKRRDYSDVKHFALKILTVLPGDFSSRYFTALCDYKSGNDAPYIDFLDVCDISRAGSEEIELVSGKIIDYAEKKHEAHIKGYFAKVYGTNAVIYNARLDKAIADGIERLRRTGVRDCDLFICHSSADADEAKKLVSALENAGLTCWLSEINLLPGTQNYEEELAGAIAHCRMMLFLSSANSIYSKECEKELRMANADGKLFFVVKLDKEPFYGTSRNVLSSVQWLNAFDGVTPHCDEIASEIKMAFEDDAKEKAELERRALEARKRAEEAARAQTAKAATVVNVSTGATNNAEVFLIQIKECTKNYKEFTENKDKAVSLVDRGLELNPDNAKLWYYKFLLDVYDRYRDVGSIANNDFAKTLEKELKVATDRVWREKADYYCDCMKEIKSDYVRSDVYSALIDKADLSYTGFIKNARSIKKWDSVGNMSLSEYIINEIVSKASEVFDNTYFKFAEQKADEKRVGFFKSVVDRAAKRGAEIRENAVARFAREIPSRNKALIERQKKWLDGVEHKYAMEVSPSYDRKAAELNAQKSMYTERLNDPDKDAKILTDEAIGMHARDRDKLTVALSDYEHQYNASKKELSFTRVKNFLAIFVDPVMFMLKLLISCLVIVVLIGGVFAWIGIPILIAISNKNKDFINEAFEKIWVGWGFIKINRTSLIKKYIKSKKQAIDGIKEEIAENDDWLDETLKNIPLYRKEREANYKAEIVKIDSSLDEIADLQFEILEIVSTVAYNRKELEDIFNPSRAILESSMSS